MLRRRDLLGAAAAAALVAGCAPPPFPIPRRSESPTATSNSPTAAPTSRTRPPSSGSTDFTQPGVATDVLNQLVVAAGTINAIKVVITADAATLSVVSGEEATTWAWRDGAPQVVDSDTQFVGQAMFNPRRFDVSDVAAMFATAVEYGCSPSEQELQIVEYSDRRVLMTVTSNPESTTVFFKGDAVVLPPIDLQTRQGVSIALTEVIGGKTQARGVGILPDNGGVWADVAGAGNTVTRKIRMGKFPTRTSARIEPVALPNFDPQEVDYGIVWDSIQRCADESKAPMGTNWKVDIDRRNGAKDARMYVQVNNKSMTFTLNGVDITR